MTPLINIILGLPLLVLGRRLFGWFVGALGLVGGFLAGYLLSIRYIDLDFNWLPFVVGTVLGVLGILIAVYMQRVAVVLAGFVAGILLTRELASDLLIDLNVGMQINTEALNSYLPLLGGLVGCFLILLIFDWALMLLSSLVGAILLNRAFFDLIQFKSEIRNILFFALVAVGLVVQYLQLFHEMKNKKAKREETEGLNQLEQPPDIDEEQPETVQSL